MLRQVTIEKEEEGKAGPNWDFVKKVCNLKIKENEDEDDNGLEGMATKTHTETKREITVKDDVVTVTEIITVTKTAPGKDPVVKESKKVKQYKGKEGYSKLPEDIRAKLELPKDQMESLQPLNLQATKKNFAEDCLKEHNNYRQHHGVEPLKLNKHLVEISENRARNLAKRDKVQIQEDQTYGENLSWIGSNDPNHTVDAAQLMAKWYSEEKNYNYEEEPKDLNSGHFTQMIWKNTKEFGIGAAKSHTNKIYVVATYNPPGNFRGEFLENVFSPDSENAINFNSAKRKKKLSISDLNKQCVEIHNSYRKLHGVPPLKYSKNLANYAQEWAEELARKDRFEHSPNNNYGENLFQFKSSHPRESSGAYEACKSWYSEIEHYDFSSEPKSLKTSHFTQMVWKNTKEVGMGKALSKSGYQYVVANYYPPGNYKNQYKKNVFPPKK